MADDSAITPSKDAILKIRRNLKEVDEEPYLDKEDKSYNEIAEMSGWKNLKEYMDRRLQAIKPKIALGQASSDDDFLKGYGIRSLIHQIVSDEYNAIIKRVEQSDEAVKEERTKREAKRIRKT